MVPAETVERGNRDNSVSRDHRQVGRVAKHVKEFQPMRHLGVFFHLQFALDVDSGKLLVKSLQESDRSLR